MSEKDFDLNAQIQAEQGSGVQPASTPVISWTSAYTVSTIVSLTTVSVGGGVSERDNCSMGSCKAATC